MTTVALTYLLLGAAVLAAVVLPQWLQGRPLTLPIVFLGFGIAGYASSLPLPDVDPIADVTTIEHVTEAVVVIALAETGIALDRPLGWRTWRTVWRLLMLGMPITALALIVLGVWWLGLPLAVAVLLAAVLTPTDPVLASEVQVPPPSASRHGEDEVRFGLTGESGLNDGLAFVLVYVAFTFLALRGGADPDGEWWNFVAVDVVWRTATAVIIGAVIGRLLGRLLLWSRHDGTVLAGSFGGLPVLAAAFLGYGLTLLVGGYGFIAAFITALAMRSLDPDHEHHQHLHAYAAGLGQLATGLVLFMLAGPLIRGDLLAALEPVDVLFALAVVFVLRPAAAALALARGRTGPRERAALAFFGMRGLSSVYYLAFALARVDVGVDPARLWALVALVVLISVAVHGVTAGWAVTALDRTRRDRLDRRGKADPDDEVIAGEHV
jgi:NhaP-type Na+/H+ or K+/H+ antiporter